jgi:serine/threonine protein kinase
MTDCTIVVEEFIYGKTLGDLMEGSYQFTYKQIKSIANQLASAMAELHRNNIIHRDIKPDNIIMNEHGQIWLIDYDIARIYSNEIRKDTTVLGTVGYAPVEQFGMMPTDFKTDIYAFGATILQLLEYAGKRGSLYKIAQKCKRLDPSQRYQDTEHLQRALKFQSTKPMIICIIAELMVIAAIACVILWNINSKNSLDSNSEIIPEVTASVEEKSENIYAKYIGTWRDENGIILEMLNIEGNTAKFNIKAKQPNGSIRSINNVTGEIEDNTIKFSEVITDFGDTSDGTITLGDSIQLNVYTANTNTSASINADTTLIKDIEIKVNDDSVQLAENPPVMIDNDIFVPAEDFPRALKLNSYYDSGFWAGDSETRITIMNKDTIIYFSTYDNSNWNLYVTHDENIQTSYNYEYEQISIISEQPRMIDDVIYIPLQVLTEQFSAEMTYDENERVVNITADTSESCKTEVEIKTIEAFDSEKAYDIAKLKYSNLMQSDGMPHYNHKGKFFMFLTGEGTTAYVYDSGMIEIN